MFTFLWWHPLHRIHSGYVLKKSTKSTRTFSFFFLNDEEKKEILTAKNTKSLFLFGWKKIVAFVTCCLTLTHIHRHTHIQTRTHILTEIIILVMKLMTLHQRMNKIFLCGSSAVVLFFLNFGIEFCWRILFY